MSKSPVSRFERFYKFLGFRLEPFQREIVGELFAGRRESLILLPRGNGKSTLLAALSLFHLLTRPDAKVAIGAASREQAQTLFDMARSMASNPQIARQVAITRREIRTKTGWTKVIASDGPKQHGLVVTLAIVDELHAHHDDELYIALRTGLLKRPDAQMWTISTAGIGEESALGLLHARAKQGKIERNGYLRSTGKNLGMLEWALPDDADVDNMKVVKSVNPASWLDEGVLAEQREAVHDIAFRRYHCNQWVAAEAPWITGDVWDACKAKPKLDPERKTILGVDASIRHDSTVVATVQRTEDGTFHAVFKPWVPTRGHEVKMEIVVEHIRQQCKEFNVTGVCFDPYFMHHAAQILEDEGVPMIEWKQDNAQPLDEPVLTPSGWRAIGLLGVGDEVIGGDGHPTRVVAVNDRGAWPVHEVSFTDGAMTRCTAGHLWLTASPTQRYLGSPGTVRSLSEIQEIGLTRGTSSNCFVPLVTAQLAERSFPVEPYTLGVLLSDGHFGHTVTLSCSDAAIVDRVSSVLPPGMAVKTRQGQWHTLSSGAGCKSNPLTEGLRQVGVWGLRAWEKFVPEQYLLGSSDQRLALLQGLMDGDGTVSGSAASFHTTSTGLRDGVVALARSLGGTGRATALRCYSPGRRPAWRVTVSLPTPLSPFGLPRKADAYRRQHPPHRAMSGIREVGTLPVRCITVAAEDGLYVTRDYVVTHNSRMVPATRTLHEAVVSGKLRHGGDPIARSHALAGEVVETERGIRIKKTAGSGPNDSLVALAMAVEWASRQDAPRRSVYDDRSLVSA